MDKDSKILDVLKKNPEGIHLQELSRESGIPYSTVCYRLANSLKDSIIKEETGNGKKSIVTKVFLKEFAARNGKGAKQ